jgi:rhodanese-related sulfurtransferase
LNLSYARHAKKPFKQLHFQNHELNPSQSGKFYMAQNISKSVKKMVADASEDITTLSIADARDLINSPNHVMVDLRDIRELQRTGKIPGAFSCPRGMLEFWIDPESPYHKDIFNQDKTYVFLLCQRMAVSAQYKTCTRYGSCACCSH